MSNRVMQLFALMALLGLHGCGDKNGARKGPCTNGELPACGVACSAAQPCQLGLYCNDQGLCSAECTEQSLARDCASGQACTFDGKCVAGVGQEDGGGVAGQDGGNAGGGGNPGGGDVCAEVKLDATPKTPNVVLVIDQSSSMAADFGSSNRWDALKDSLLANGGLIADLQGSVRFGLALYSSKNGSQNGATCPLLTQVDPALNNLQAIDTVYRPAGMIEDTPTGDAIESLTAYAQAKNLVGGDDPTIFVLATDGEPDTCDEPDPGDNTAAKQKSIAAIESAFKLGIRTYIIAVAEDNELSDEHVQDVANAGVGLTSPQTAPSYRVQDDAGLRAALQGIVAGELSCVVPLKGKVTASDPCVGTVKLNDQVLECDGKDGWKLTNESTLEVQGSACDKLKLGGDLTASFPCDAAVVL